MRHRARVIGRLLPRRPGSSGLPPRKARFGLFAGGLPLVHTAALSPDGDHPNVIWTRATQLHYPTLSGAVGLLLTAVIIAVPCALLHRRRVRRAGRATQ